MAIAEGLFEWDINQISAALKISPTDVHAYFTDGRRVSFLLERRIAYEVLNGSLASSEGAGYDVLDSQGRKWEVRSVSKGGIYFCPSYMVGSGRHFEEHGFLKKLQEIFGYVVSDIQQFPAVSISSLLEDPGRHRAHLVASGQPRPGFEDQSRSSPVFIQEDIGDDPAT